MTTNVRRHHRVHAHFTQISNDFIRDVRIRPSAFRMACFLLSHDATFNVPQERIASMLDMSTGTVAKAMRELEELGYLVRVELRTERGYRLGTQLHLSDEGFTPEEVESLTSNFEGPETLTPETEDSVSLGRVSGGHKKTNSNKKTKTQEDHSSSSAAALDPEPALFEDPLPEQRKEPKPDFALEFNEFWLSWPHKVGKNAAEKAYVKARQLKDAPTAEKLVAVALALAARYSRAAKERRRFMPHASTWLNRHGWHEAPEDTFADLGGASGGPSDLQKNGSYDDASAPSPDYQAQQEKLRARPTVEMPTRPANFVVPRVTKPY